MHSDGGNQQQKNDLTFAHAVADDTKLTVSSGSYDYRCQFLSTLHLPVYPFKFTGIRMTKKESGLYCNKVK